MILTREPLTTGDSLFDTGPITLGPDMVAIAEYTSQNPRTGDVTFLFLIDHIEGRYHPSTHSKGLRKSNGDAIRRQRGTVTSFVRIDSLLIRLETVLGGSPSTMIELVER